MSCATTAAMVLALSAGVVAVHPAGSGPFTHTASPPFSSCQSLRDTGGDPFAIVGTV